MKRATAAASIALGGIALAGAQSSHPLWFQGLSDLSIYLKPRFTTPNVWDEQAGIRARLWRQGNFSAEYSIAYDPLDPLKFDVKPRWTTGVQFAYFFTRIPFPIGVYTAPKYDLVGVWKEEFGLNLRFVSTRRYYVNSSIDYAPTFPYVSGSKPAFQASLTVGVPLGR